MTGLDTLQRRIVEMLKVAKTITIEFPVSDYTIEKLSIDLTDRTAIHRVALDVQTAWIEQNRMQDKDNGKKTNKNVYKPR